MGKTSEAKIKYFDGDDFTCVTFQPDLAKFKMEKLDKDIVALLTRRAYDVAGSCRGVKVMLNGKKLPVSHLSFPPVISSKKELSTQQCDADFLFNLKDIQTFLDISCL